jgi:hypothetical protein
MSERELRCERDGRRGGSKSFVCPIGVHEDESEDSVRKWVFGLLAQSFSKGLFSVLEATEVAERKCPIDRVLCEIAAHLRPRYSRTAS